MDRCKISKWEVVLGAPDRVSIPCLFENLSKKKDKNHEKGILPSS